MIEDTRCPLCGMNFSGARTVRWDKPPTPEQMIEAWELLGQPGVVTVSVELQAHACRDDVELPEHVLFGTVPAPPGERRDHVECSWGVGAGYWMRPGGTRRVERWTLWRDRARSQWWLVPEEHCAALEAGEALPQELGGTRVDDLEVLSFEGPTLGGLRPRREPRAESLASQVDRLAKFIVEEVPGEPSENQGAIDTAIRLLRAAHAAPNHDKRWD